MGGIARLVRPIHHEGGLREAIIGASASSDAEGAARRSEAYVKLSRAGLSWQISPMEPRGGMRLDWAQMYGAQRLRAGQKMAREHHDNNEVSFDRCRENSKAYRPGMAATADRSKLFVAGRAIPEPGESAPLEWRKREAATLACWHCERRRHLHDSTK